MSETILFGFLGHLIGDYLLQTKNMALNKSAKGWKGFWLCTAHIAIYTASVCGMVSIVQPITIEFVASIFFPHWLIDRYSFASWWLKKIKGRTFVDAFKSTDKYREFDIAFTAIVYTVTDNTFHLLCLVGSTYWFL